MTPWFITLPWLHYLDFTYNEVYHEARFEKDKRYYVLRLEKDLLDDWTITAINGRIKSKLGQRRILDFSTYTNAFAQFLIMIKIRYQHNYRLKILYSENIFSLHNLLFLLVSQKYANKTHAKRKEKPRSELSQNNCSTTVQNNLSHTKAFQLDLFF
ncbi:TPA: hypothetical protein SLD83_001775 [Legionella pneumophila]|uniref:Transposase n=1 Tax=Legionella bononiensis TaxID=2793102 RepID=A0ABS1WEW4_9GAMM|nr:MULTISPECIES: hypothetical protein [Legionellaceae]ERH41507.1 hypothetical protein N750_16380 [Legionella pneumophila str. Leg01/53]ERI48035.1 hypothetical protein N749_11415 [Legionella pneumophila str. Leg01/20]HAT9652194.1 hypothetical protein [Legionella pneumophila subsp. pneumophila]KTD12356.1 hypothetical protein Lhac_1227 [Legionella hackeliae]MBL7478692.1 hypothetical protein [Legionella bononiensis]